MLDFSWVKEIIPYIKNFVTFKRNTFLCESCHKGLYCYKGLEYREKNIFIESWICDKCGSEAGPTWKKRNDHDISPPLR